VAKLSGGAGPNLDAANVRDDGAQDRLTGGSERDWFFRGTGDKLSGEDCYETITVEGKGMAQVSAPSAPAVSATTMLADAAQTNTATFHGLHGSIDLGTFDGKGGAGSSDKDKDCDDLPHGWVVVDAAHAKPVEATAPAKPAPAAKPAQDAKVDWNAPAAKLDMPLLSKVGAAVRKNIEAFITVWSGSGKDKDHDRDHGKRR
jgi:hypothetical protein